MKDALTRLVSSAKFWTLVLGLLTTFLAKYGVHVDDSTSQYIAMGFALLLGAQAAADHGKSAALINAAAAAPAIPAAPAAPAAEVKAAP